MAVVQLYNGHKIGIIKDLPDHKLPPEAWTNVRNMRFGEERMSRITGDVAVMGTPSAAPSFLMPVESVGGVFWIYAEAKGAGSRVFAFNSGLHADISKSGNYNVPNFRDWNGTIFHGTPIINPVGDDPQYLATISLATDLADLPNWPASTTAKLIRTYKNYLVALYTTTSGNASGHRVRWSHFASAGSLPSSWDFTDPTVDAGVYELSDVKSGLIQEAQPIRTDLAIYKDESTWLMRFIGGQDVMAFSNVMQTSGVLGPRCVCPLTLPVSESQVHFLMNGIDIGIFDGARFETVIDKRLRKYILANIDAISFGNSFVFDNNVENEAWFCYPRTGSSIPNEAVIWNYKENNLTIRDFNATHAASGPVESSSTLLWSTVTGSWDAAAASKWQEGARRKVVVADQAGTLLRQVDFGATFNGTAYSSLLERTGLAVVGMDWRTNEPKVDFQKIKQIVRIWPKIKGGRVRVTVGSADEFDEIGNPVPDYTPTPFASNSEIYVPGGGVPYVDVISKEGRLLAVKYEGVDGDHWEMDGYDVDVNVLSEH